MKSKRMKEIFSAGGHVWSDILKAYQAGETLTGWEMLELARAIQDLDDEVLAIILAIGAEPIAGLVRSLIENSE